MRNRESETRGGGPRGRVALAVAAILVAMLPARVIAQLTTTTVQGTVYRADGTPASGTLLISWSAFTTPQNQAVAAGSLSASIGRDGFVSVNLTPNAAALPTGSYYTAVYHLNDGTVNQEYWVVPASGTASIGSIRARLQPSTVAVQSVSKSYVDSAISSLNGSWLSVGGGTMTGPLLLSSDPLASSQAATKHYADQLAAQSLPLSGGNVAGTVSMLLGQSKLPRVDITHPDFGAAAGCANGADPLGVQDSTCAINAAVAWLVKQGINGQYPALYIPRGTFKVSGTIRVPMFINILGDGPQSSILQETGNGNLLTVAPLSGYSGMAWFFGGVIRDIGLAGNGHLTSGTLLELQGSAETVENVLFFNHGGRALTGYENSERSNFNQLFFQQVRWPMVVGGYEYRVSNLTASSPGSDRSGYCWGANCVNGVFPSAGGQTLVAATGGSGTQTYVLSGNSGKSPVAAGHYVYFSGIASVTALNGYYQVVSAANNSPVSGQFTITVQGGASGSGSVAGATFATALVPDNRHAAVWVGGGYENTFSGGELKPLTYLPGFKLTTVNNTSIQQFYEEGYLNSVNPGLILGGLPDQMFGSGTTTTCTAGTNNYACMPVTSDTAQWWPAYIGLAADIPANAGALSQVFVTYVFPCDYNPASSQPSSCNAGVKQNQYEVASVAVAGDTGKAYFLNRGLSGSTAPANTAWVNPVFEGVPGGGLSTGTGLKSTRNEFIAANPQSLQPGYVPYCADGTANQCAEIEAGSMDDGYIHFQYGWNTGGTPTSVTSLAALTMEDFLAPGNPESTGSQWTKVSSRAAISFPLGKPSSSAEGSEISTAPGSLTQNSSLPPIQVTSPSGILTVTSPAVNYTNMGGFAPPYFVQELSGSNAGLSSYFGSNPGTGWVMGLQYYGSRCWFGSGSAAHADLRTCVTDAKSGKANFQVDSWNGSSWAAILSASASGLSASSLSVTGSLKAQGAITGATINNEITVDGTTYTSLNAAWNAAVSKANSTGQNQTVHLGPGTFPVTATLAEPTNGACVSVLGSAGTTMNADSPQIATTLTVPGPLGGDIFYMGNAVQTQGCTFRDLNILAGSNALRGFELQWFRGLLIDNVTINDTGAEGILLGEQNTASGHQSSFVLRNTTVSYSSAAFTPANRPAYGIHLQKTAMDSYLDNITVRNALTAALYNEGSGNTGYLIHGFGYPYTCTTAPCSNIASSGAAANASYATSYVIYDTGGAGTVWTDTYADSPAVAGFYVGANGVEIHGGHIQWPDLTSFPAANLAWVAAGVTNNLLIADVDCLGMASGVNWITYAGVSGNPPTYASVHHLTGCGNYYQALEPANTSGFSSGGANINDPSGAIPRVWSTPIASAASYPAYSAQLYTGYQGDAFQAHFSGQSPFFNITYQGTIRSNGGMALNTVVNTAATLTLTTANRNVIANASSAAQTITLPSCFTPLPDKASPAGLEITVIKSDTSANAVTLQTVSSQTINYGGLAAQTLAIGAAGKRTLVCGPDYTWYAY